VAGLVAEAVRGRGAETGRQTLGRIAGEAEAAPLPERLRRNREAAGPSGCAGSLVAQRCLQRVPDVFHLDDLHG
jgi:hypothetical protein